ncbi:lytic transglycosylase domain-containing protein [Solimonas soli]|uniref:LysM peptidoglycan-binding domain-containing protein n=1 Tax=Solimonas soli TaxID=413479 RepID=UPI0005BE6F45
MTCLAFGLAAAGASQLVFAQAAPVADEGDDPPAPLRGSETPVNAAAAPGATLPNALTNVISNGATNANLPRYDALKPAVSFWTRVFSQYSELQSVVHSSVYPNKVFMVLDYRDDATTTDKFVLDKRRRAEEADAKDHVDDVLKRVQAKQYAPETMSAEERRIYDLFADVPGADKFSKQIGTARVQRGLKERTENALEVSNRYLPSMEATFRNYGLPAQLTRLPLVESSFNLQAYSKSGAAGIWQFIPSSARIYMRLDDVVDDRRDPWTSTDAAARHLRDDYTRLQDWPLAITAYNHGRNGIARALDAINGKTLMDLIERWDGPRFGFASRNYYAEFLAAVDVERAYRERVGALRNSNPLEFEIVETRNYVPYDTLRRLCGASDEVFQRLNPAYRPEVIEGKLYVPPGHLIRVPYGSARAFEVGYAKLGSHERFDSQRALFLLHRIGRGDSLGKIARQYGVSQGAILKVNDLKSAHRLRVGAVLKIPPKTESRPGPITVAVGDATPQQTLQQKIVEAKEEQRDNDAAATKGATGRARKKAGFRTHKVQSGQTLSGIAQRYNVSVSDLRAANHLKGSNIRPGQKLKVPLDS